MDNSGQTPPTGTSAGATTEANVSGSAFDNLGAAVSARFTSLGSRPGSGASQEWSDARELALACLDALRQGVQTHADMVGTQLNNFEVAIDARLRQVAPSAGSGQLPPLRAQDRSLPAGERLTRHLDELTALFAPTAPPRPATHYYGEVIALLGAMRSMLSAGGAYAEKDGWPMQVATARRIDAMAQKLFTNGQPATPRPASLPVNPVNQGIVVVPPGAEPHTPVGQGLPQAAPTPTPAASTEIHVETPAPEPQEQGTASTEQFRTTAINLENALNDAATNQHAEASYEQEAFALAQEVLRSLEQYFPTDQQVQSKLAGTGGPFWIALSMLSLQGGSDLPAGLRDFPLMTPTPPTREQIVQALAATKELIARPPADPAQGAAIAHLHIDVMRNMFRVLRAIAEETGSVRTTDEFTAKYEALMKALGPGASGVSEAATAKGE